MRAPLMLAPSGGGGGAGGRATGSGGDTTSGGDAGADGAAATSGSGAADARAGAPAGDVGAAIGTYGSVSVNVVPEPTSESTLICPPRRVMMLYATARPSPLPLGPFVEKNGSKMRARTDSGMPWPE